MPDNNRLTETIANAIPDGPGSAGGGDRTLTDAQLKQLDVEAMNSRLRACRVELRATAADAQRFVELWNQHKACTTATRVADRAAGWYQIAILDD